MRTATLCFVTLTLAFAGCVDTLNQRAEERVQRRAAFDLRCSSVDVVAVDSELSGQTRTFGASGCGRQASYVRTPSGEWIANVVSSEAPGSSRDERAPPPGAGNDTRPGQALWNALFVSLPATARCGAAYDLLIADEQCDGEECRGALMLGGVYVDRCREGDPEGARRVAALTSEWRTRASGAEGHSCGVGLVRAATTPSLVAAYRSVCLKSRRAGAVESRVLQLQSPPGLAPSSTPATAPGVRSL